MAQYHQCDLCEYWGTLVWCGPYDLCPACAEEYEQEKLDAEYDRDEEEDFYGVPRP